MKTCKGCGIEKPVDEYHKHKQSKDGRNPRCKTCRSNTAAEHYAKPEVRERRAEYRVENRERISAQRAEYRARPEVKAQRAEYMREYWAKNKEDLTVRGAEYYAENRDKILAQKAEYRSRPEVKARQTTWHAEHRAANPHLGWEAGFRWRCTEYGFPHLIETMESFTKDDVIERYGNKCYHCGGEFEQLDHHPIPVAHGGGHTLENTKPSCWACNRPGGIRRLDKTDIGETA